MLGEAGVARLIARADLAHHDDRPRLEFVAARRFLDPGGMGDVFDSLVAIGRAAADGATPEQLATALTERRGDASGFEYVDAVRRRWPGVPRWTVQVAAMWLVSGDSTFADTALGRLAARRNDDALLLSGLMALRRNQLPRARSLLTEAVVAGGDTAEALAALAVVAARDRRWSESAAHVAEALSHARDTFRHPFPRDLLGEALRALAFDGSPGVTDTLLARTLQARPGWATLYELRAVTALREGECDVAVSQFLTLLEFGIDRPDGPDLVSRCRRGEHGGA